jgi:DNA ligase-1
MDFITFTDVLEELENTSKRGEKTAIIARFLHGLQTDQLTYPILLLQGRVFPSWDKQKLNVAAKTLIKALARSSGHTTKAIEDLWREKGDLGLVAEEVTKEKQQSTLFSETLTIEKVFSNLHKLPTIEGKNSVQQKIMLIAELLTSAKPKEAKYITRTALEVLRVGIGEGILRDALVWSKYPDLILRLYEKDEAKEIEHIRAIAKGTAIEGDAREQYNRIIDQVQHAFDMCNEFPKVAKALKEDTLHNISLELNKPLRVMLAQKVATIKDGFKKVGTPAAIEYKYDGFRMQIHIQQNNIRLFTRRLEEVTEQFPDVIEAIKAHVTCNEAILDCEVIGYNTKTNMYQPFQQISQRIRRKYDIERLVKELPVEVAVFDILYYDGNTLLKEPFQKRRNIITKIIDPKDRVIIPSRIMISDNEEEANKFYQESLDAGNEGVMFKSLDSPYQPGSRVGFMVKMKQVMETLDLVITKATWGEGRRATWLTSFTIACIDQDGEFKEVGKVSTGLKELEAEGTNFKEMTELLQPLIIAEEGKDVQVKPEIVIEVAYEEIQKSPTYTSGYALRFPRFIRLRERAPDEISALDMVEEFYGGQ